jgi:hypothetical protein
VSKQVSGLQISRCTRAIREIAGRNRGAKNGDVNKQHEGEVGGAAPRLVPVKPENLISVLIPTAKRGLACFHTDVTFDKSYVTR